MDIIQFQNKLKELQTLALNNGKKIQAALVEKFFAEDEMDAEKLKKVYDYLEIQGIHVEGYDKRGEKKEGHSEVQHKQEEKTGILLTKEEEEYLEEYLQAFGQAEELEREKIISSFLAGETWAKDALIRSYQKEVVQAARDLNCEEIFFGDLLQEGNMGLLMALENIAEQKEFHSWLCSEIESTIRLFIEDQTEQKKEDDILVEKVRNLEARVKELTEDEDVKYSVEELAVFLDMDVEEMQAVLRLTGDDK